MTTMIGALRVAGVAVAVTAFHAWPAAAQIREVRGLLGVRYDRLSGGGGATDNAVLGQARVEVLGVVLRPEVASFSLLAESRRGVVTAPASYGLFRIGAPTTVAQATIRLDVAPRSPVSGSADYGVSRVLETATNLGSVQHSVGIRGVMQGGARLPMVAVGLRRGQVRLIGGSASRARYAQTTLDLSKSSERSYVAAGLRSDRTPEPGGGGGPGWRQTTANLTGTNQLSETLRFSVTGSYADQRSLFSSQSGTMNATLSYLAAGGTAATLSAATDFAGFQRTRTRTQHVRLDATRPVARGLSAGGVAAVRRQGGVQAGGPDLTQSAVSAAGVLVSSFTLGGRPATVAAQGGYSHQSAAGPDGERRPQDAVLLGANASIPTLTLGWLALTSGFQIERLFPAAGAQGSLSYVLSEVLALTAPQLRWTTSAIYTRSETPAILTAQTSVGQPLAPVVGPNTRGTLQTDLSWAVTGRLSASASARADRQFRPVGGTALTATGRLTVRADHNLELVGEALLFQYSGLFGTDFANFGLMATQRYRLLELHSEVRYVRPLGGALPSRTYVTGSLSRAFSVRFR